MNIDPVNVMPWSSDWVWNLPLRVTLVAIHVLGFYFIYLAEVRPGAGPSELAPDEDYRFSIHRQHYGFGHSPAWAGGCHLGHGVPLASRPAQ